MSVFLFTLSNINNVKSLFFLEFLSYDKVELAATTIPASSYRIETISPVDSHQPIIGNIIRAPNPAERFRSNGLNFFRSSHALPASTNPNI